MIYLRLLICNPWGDRNFKSLYSKSGKLTKNKRWEFECSKYPTDLLGFKIDSDYSNRSHAGILVELSLLSYTISVTIYDSRHWNYVTKTWESL